MRLSARPSGPAGQPGAGAGWVACWYCGHVAKPTAPLATLAAIHFSGPTAVLPRPLPGFLCRASPPSSPRAPWPCPSAPAAATASERPATAERCLAAPCIASAWSIQSYKAWSHTASRYRSSSLQTGAGRRTQVGDQSGRGQLLRVCLHPTWGGGAHSLYLAAGQRTQLASWLAGRLPARQHGCACTCCCD